MKSIRFLSPVALTAALLGVLTGFSLPLQAQSNAENAKSQFPSPQNPAVSLVRYLGFAAYRLSDGRSEAVIVPELGRVMRYAMVGGKNLLWNGVPGKTKPGEWRNWGGDKSWPAPQSQWPLSIGHGWPPHPSWDGQAYSTTVLPAGRLRITSDVWPRFGCRVSREFRFEANGDFVVAQTYEKLSGPPVELALWSITQIATPQAIFAAANPNSVYKNGFHWLTKPDAAKISPDLTLIHPEMLRIRPNDTSAFKIGLDAPKATVISVQDGIAFRQRAETPAGNYPDGARGSGFPIEIYDVGGTGTGHYMEMELLSPLRLFYVGTRWTHTVRWSLHPLQNDHVDAPEFTSLF